MFMCIEIIQIKLIIIIANEVLTRFSIKVVPLHIYIQDTKRVNLRESSASACFAQSCLYK